MSSVVDNLNKISKATPSSIFAMKRNNSFQLSSLLQKASDDTNHGGDESDHFLHESLKNESTNKTKLSNKLKSYKLSTINSEPNLQATNNLTITTQHLTNNSGGGGGHKSPNKNGHVNNPRVYRSAIEYYRLKLSRSKLKAVTRTSALLSGFAMVAMVELTLNYNDYFDDINRKEALKLTTKMANLKSSSNGTWSLNSSTTIAPPQRLALDESLSNRNSQFLVPEYILILYSFVTCLLVGVNMLALMIGTCILPHVEASSYENVEFEQQQQQHMHQQSYLSASHSQLFNTGNIPGGGGAINGNLLLQTTPKLNNTMITDYHQVRFPHRDFHNFIECSWLSSTVVGIFLFLVEIGLVCYIKFYPISSWAALTGAFVMTPILAVFVVFTVTFYKRLAQYKLTITEQFLKQV
jgi:hypothetical protein